MVGPVPRSADHTADESPIAATPAEFTAAVDSLQRTTVRSDIRIEPVRPPQRLAPWSFALAADIAPQQAGVPPEAPATGRLVVLHDPDGHEGWRGTLRLVGFITAGLDHAMSVDPLLLTVGWSWLVEGLTDRRAQFTAAGGTVTRTTSARFGELAGSEASAALELRASWTATTSDLAPHLLAFVDVLAIAAGLPPEGVTLLGRP